MILLLQCMSPLMAHSGDAGRPPWGPLIGVVPTWGRIFDRFVAAPESTSTTSRPDISERRDDVVVSEHPSDCRRHQAEGEAVHFLAVHRIDGVRGDDDAVVTVRRLEAAA